MVNLYEVKISTFNGKFKQTKTVEAHARCSIDALVNAVRAVGVEGSCHVFVKPVINKEINHG